MTFEEYQINARKFAIYGSPLYPLFALSEETGELHKIYAKKSRGDADYQDVNHNLERIRGELGDILWMISNIAADNMLSLEDIAAYNIEKLSRRVERNVIKGDGDNR